MGLASMLAMGAGVYKNYEQMRVERQKLNLHNQTQQLNKQINIYAQNKYDNMQDNLAKMFGAGLADELVTSEQQVRKFDQFALPYINERSEVDETANQSILNISNANKSILEKSTITKPVLAKPAIERLGATLPITNRIASANFGDTVSKQILPDRMLTNKLFANESDIQSGTHTLKGESQRVRQVHREREEREENISQQQTSRRATNGAIAGVGNKPAVASKFASEIGAKIGLGYAQQNYAQQDVTSKEGGFIIHGDRYKKPLHSAYSGDFSRVSELNRGSDVFSFKKFSF